MCGIVGAVGSAPCENIIFSGLKKLQYRGYDSAGICVKKQGELEIVKATGLIEKLSAKYHSFAGKSGIAHTRWATHGVVCEKNAHPIASNDKSWAVVHNGIIENYAEIQNELVSEGMRFVTDTDTEVVSALLGLNNFSGGIENLVWVCQKLKGSYAICAMKKEEEDVIYAARNKSPLYVYHDASKSIVASDPICFPAGSYFRLEDGEFAKISQKNVHFFNSKAEKIEKLPFDEMYENVEVDKDGYEHFMLKEIYETPECLKRLCENFERLDFSKLRKMKFEKVKLVGCGTAYHSCLMGARYIKKHLKIDAEAVCASEFRYDECILSSSTLCIFVSQSGETADTLAATAKAKKFRCKSIALTNVCYSSLASLAQVVLPISAGPEIAVASTKAYSCQVAALYLFVMALKGERQFQKALKSVLHLSKELGKFFVNVSLFAGELKNAEHIFFIGKGSDYVTALEGALKLKEISYINCNAFPAGELKHGVLTLIENKTPVIVIATEKDVYEKTMNSAYEAKSRGAKLFLISEKPPTLNALDKFEMCLSLPKVCADLVCLLAIKPLQLLSYNVSLMRGVCPDTPRNLAKSVTVE